jgi:hypothetical protein
MLPFLVAGVATRFLLSDNDASFLGARVLREKISAEDAAELLNQADPCSLAHGQFGLAGLPETQVLPVKGTFVPVCHAGFECVNVEVSYACANTNSQHRNIGASSLTVVNKLLF